MHAPRNSLIAWLIRHGVEDAETVVSHIPHDCEIVHSKARRVLYLKVPTLSVTVEGMPTPYTLRSFRAWSTPCQTAARHYFALFGSRCSATIVGSDTSDTPLTSTVIRRDTVVKVHCRPFWTEERAATRIARWMRPRLTPVPLNPRLERRALTLPPLELGAIVHRRRRRKSSPCLRRELVTPYIESVLQDFRKQISTGHARPRAVLMSGFPGAGKNWVLDKHHKSDHVLIDVDECLMRLPRFWDGVARRVGRPPSQDDWVLSMRSEARKIADRLLDETIDARSHLVWNGTGRSIGFYSELIERLRTHHYEIELCGVAVRPNTARARMKQRERRTKRPVPKHVLVDAIECVATNFASLADSVDHARIWANESTGSPKLVWDRHQGVLDADMWMSWNCPSPLLATPRTTPSKSGDG